MSRKILYYSTNGRCPIKEFIDGQTQEVIKKIFFVFDIIQSFDRVPRKFLDKIDGAAGIWEIRIEYI